MFAVPEKEAESSLAMAAAARGTLMSRGGMTPAGETDVAEELLETAGCRLVGAEVAA